MHTFQTIKKSEVSCDVAVKQKIKQEFSWLPWPCSNIVVGSINAAKSVYMFKIRNITKILSLWFQRLWRIWIQQALRFN